MSDAPDYAAAGQPQPWQWPEPAWRRAVGRVRAGRSLAPAAWPDGARCALALAFECDHETVALDSPWPSPMRQYGARRGVPRLRALLARTGCPATFFVPGVSALLHPEEVRGLADEGHEIALHSWIGENNAALPAPTERDLLQRAAEALTRLSGRAPVGMRTTSRDFSPNTLALARKLGLLYDSSLMADDAPYELIEDGKPSGVVEIPPAWIRDDAPPADMEAAFRAEFDAALAEGGLFELTARPHIDGHRSRIGVLERLITHARDGGKIWFATHEQVARWCLDHTPEPTA